jgi:hypothetical protein
LSFSHTVGHNEPLTTNKAAQQEPGRRTGRTLDESQVVADAALA